MIPYKSCITRIEIVICKFVVHWYRIVEDIPHIGGLKVRPVASLTPKPRVWGVWIRLRVSEVVVYLLDTMLVENRHMV